MKEYIPNSISGDVRLFNIILSAILLLYGGHGIYINDLAIKIKMHRLHLTNESAIIMFASFICGCLVMLSVVVDHYDTRNNEHKYKAFSNFFQIAGYGLFAGALLVYFSKKAGIT